MRVYVAGKTHAYREVKLIQALVKNTGHQITYDWVKVIEQHGGDSNEVDISPELRTQYALNDMGGVYEADLLIALGHPHLSGTLWECGAAAVYGKPVWLVLWERYGRRSIFEDLPNVEHVDVQTLGERLWDISAKRIEMQPARMGLTPDGLLTMSHTSD